MEAVPNRGITHMKGVHTMRNGKKTGAASLLLCGVMAVSAVGMGFAKWQTTVTAGGNVSAATAATTILNGLVA